MNIGIIGDMSLTGSMAREITRLSGRVAELEAEVADLKEVITSSNNGRDHIQKQTAQEICEMILCVPEPNLMMAAFMIDKIKERYL